MSKENELTCKRCLGRGVEGFGTHWVACKDGCVAPTLPVAFTLEVHSVMKVKPPKNGVEIIVFWLGHTVAKVRWNGTFWEGRHNETYHDNFTHFAFLARIRDQ